MMTHDRISTGLPSVAARVKVAEHVMPFSFNKPDHCQAKRVMFCCFVGKGDVGGAGGGEEAVAGETLVGLDIARCGGVQAGQCAPDGG